MVEATMVLPLLVLAVLTCLLICMFFYETTARQCLMHRAMRCEADERTGHTNADARTESDGLLSVSRRGVFEVITGKEEIMMIHQGILRSRVSRQTESIWHAADGVNYVRYYTAAKRVRDGR